MRFRFCCLLALLLAGVLPSSALAAEPEAPQLTALNATPGDVDVSTAPATVTVTATVTDDTGIVAPRVRLENGSSTTETVEMTPTDLVPIFLGSTDYTADLTIPERSTPGTWNVRFDDLSDTVDPPNSAPASGPTESVEVTSDTTPPDITINTGPTGATRSSAISFTFSSSDASATFSCSLDGETPQPCKSPETYPSRAEGSHFFVVRATDRAGNFTEARDEFNVGSDPEIDDDGDDESEGDDGAPPVTTGTAPGPAAPTPAPGPPVQTTGTDTTGPAFTLTGLKPRIRATGSGRVRFTLGVMKEGATGILSLRTSSRRRATALGAMAFQTRAGQRTSLRLALNRRGLALLKRSRRVQARGAVILRDAAGIASIKTFTFVLTAP